jgi:hypothetical protein
VTTVLMPPVKEGRHGVTSRIFMTKLVLDSL